ncbi:MAG: BrnT family toxin [Allosphingosinicella sp.]
MAISYDPVKREQTLVERGLDFADAEQVLAGPQYEFADTRKEYGETRITTIGFLEERMVVVVWTQRDEDRHIISMRKANDREQRKYKDRMD